VVSIKANSGLTSGGNHPTGNVATCLNEVSFLTLVDADVRLLVLTNPDVHTMRWCPLGSARERVPGTNTAGAT
jgi:hypothetical protein